MPGTTNEAVVQDGHKYLPSIDGLRAVAVVAVIINHFHHSLLPSGYLGVDVFFVISGFVITRSLLDRPPQAFLAMLAEFYVRRLKRLIPALALVVLVGVFVIRLFDGNPTNSVLTGALSLFGVSNFFLYYLATDYFGPNALLNVFTHTWSLGVEEQFYLIFPGLLLLGGLSGRLNLRARFWTILGLSAASLLAFAAVYRFNQAAAYFLLPFRFWELGLGCLIGIRSCEGGLSPLQAKRPLLTLATTALALSFFVPLSMPVAATVLSVGLTGAAIVLIWRAEGSRHAFLSHPLVLYVGKLSYSLYLWHWLVISISRWTIGVSVMTAPVQVVLMFGLAAGSYHLVETPLRRRTWFRQRGRTILSALALMIVVAAASLGLHKFRIPQFSGVEEENEAAGILPEYTTAYSHRLMARCAMNEVYSDDPEELQRNVSRCRASKGGEDLTELLIVGDSHALDLAPTADLFFKEGRAAVTHLFQTNCQVPAPEEAPSKCLLAQAYLEKLPPTASANVVVLIRNNISPKRARGDFDSYVKRLDSLADSLLKRNYKVVYIAPAPKYYSVGPGTICTQQWFRPAWALPAQCGKGFPEPRSEQLARRAEFMEALSEMEARKPGLYVFDPFEPLCRGEGRFCSPLDNGQMLYRDDSHLTVQGAVSLYRPLLTFLVDKGLLTGSSAP